MEIKVGVNTVFVFFDKNKKATKYRDFIYDKTNASTNTKEISFGNVYALSEVNCYVYSYFVEPIMKSLEGIITSYNISNNCISLNSITPLKIEDIEKIKLLINTLESNLMIAEEAVIAKRQPIIRTKDFILENGEEILFETKEIYFNQYLYTKREKGKNEITNTFKVDKYSKFYTKKHDINYHIKKEIIFNDENPMFEIDGYKLFKGKINLETLKKIKNHYSIRELTFLFDNLKEIK